MGGATPGGVATHLAHLASGLVGRRRAPRLRARDQCAEHQRRVHPAVTPGVADAELSPFCRARASASVRLIPRAAARRSLAPRCARAPSGLCALLEQSQAGRDPRTASARARVLSAHAARARATARRGAAGGDGAQLLRRASRGVDPRGDGAQSRGGVAGHRRQPAHRRSGSVSRCRPRKDPSDPFWSRHRAVRTRAIGRSHVGSWASRIQQGWCCSSATSSRASSWTCCSAHSTT